jgi:sulfite reductase (NADPH) flavoprotein alpha-component
MTSAAIFVPESAPFTVMQRAWLNGFFAGLAGAKAMQNSAPSEAALPEDDAHGPWHDPTLPLDERMKLAEGKPLPILLSAAMGQLDCGQCGYLCQSYAKALADGAEKDPGLCIPGGKATKEKVKSLLKDQPLAAAKPSTPATAKTTTKSMVVDRARPLAAKLKECRRLTASDSEKDIRFVSIDVAGSGLTYEAGDSLGVFPSNCGEHVNALLRLTQTTGAERLPTGGSLREALRGELDLRRATDAFWDLLKDHVRGRRAELDDWANDEQGLDIAEVLHRLGSVQLPATDFAATLAKLQPRLYSISSSPREFPDEIHLTVGVVRYDLHSGPRKGTASTFLCERLQPGDSVRVFVQSSPHFRLPKDDVPVVMVGPGTGVAPFRAFVQDRAARNAQAGNWLFFGAPRRRSDFLYEHEFVDFQRRGVLKLDAAFSRDQDQKIYVQHRMQEQGGELWRWLDRGAHVYVCGDAQRMAKDVDATLTRVVAEHGEMSETAASERVTEWRKSGRYALDVY